MSDKLDFRVSTRWFDNIKIQKLVRRCGHEGNTALMLLWAYTREHKPAGNLGPMDDEDLAMISRYSLFRPASAAAFGKTLRELGLVDRLEDGSIIVHDWANDWNIYAAGAETRSNAGKRAVLIRWLTKAGHCRDELREMPLVELEALHRNPDLIRGVYGPYTEGNTPSGPVRSDPKRTETNPPNPPAGGETWMEHLLYEWQDLAATKGYSGGERKPALTPKRRKAMAARPQSWRQEAKEAMQRLRERGKPFLAGKNDRGWKADLKWFLKPDTVAEILEGAWDDPGTDHKPDKHGRPYDPKADEKSPQFDPAYIRPDYDPQIDGGYTPAQSEALNERRRREEDAFYAEHFGTPDE